MILTPKKGQHPGACGCFVPLTIYSDAAPAYNSKNMTLFHIFFKLHEYTIPSGCHVGYDELKLGLQLAEFAKRASWGLISIWIK